MIDVMCTCGCERNRHYSEQVSTGDVTKPGSAEPQYFACLVVHCSCLRFAPKTGDKTTRG